MNIPKNGRIAIIDDQISQAEPLIKVLSKRQLPLTYFSGDPGFLPEIGDNLNDIRVLFLDINLIDNREYPNKVLKGRLIPVLERVISEENYPYVLIYWSRHEHHKNLIEDEIFSEELVSRKPIGYLSAVKSDFFNLDGTPTDDFDIKLGHLFDKINGLVNEHPAYSHLINWENQVHFSADATLQSIFSPFNDIDWDNNANYTLSKLGEAYLGKHYKSTENEEKIKGSFISLSTVFKDILEHNLQNQAITNNEILTYTEGAILKSVNSLNSSLNTANYINNITESGNVLEYQENDTVFKKLLFGILSFFRITNSIKDSNPDITEDVLKKSADKEFKKIRKDIEKVWRKVCVVVTPVCDFAQKKNVNDRIVKGLLIPKEYRDFIEDKSEAVLIIPFIIELEKKEYYLALDFRYFITTDLTQENVTGLFRIRQELLSEIQSKLSRHINRQGILIIDER
ncbi:hypothetical protein [Yeosuana marina]|uniref:hypothetical protein n=1 Tax=Yeosuana marina TaxID=1565536 RepID=UPI0030EF5FC9|tara:strand:- start:2295 stop:3659 length:1365 start_codon:yes stop_codon:yes gene_type:complete